MLVALMFFSAVPASADNPYPPPTFPFPGNPPPDKPYVWGAYNLDENYRWYVTKFTFHPRQTYYPNPHKTLIEL